MTFEETLREVVTEAVRKVLREELSTLVPPAAPPVPAAQVLLTVEDVADRCHVDEKTVRAWISAGNLHAKRAGRRYVIEPADLERYLAGQRNRAQPTVDDEVKRLLDGL